MNQKMEDLIALIKEEVAKLPADYVTDYYELSDVLIDQKIDWHAVHVEGPDWGAYALRVLGKPVIMPWFTFEGMFPNAVKVAVIETVKL